MKIKLIASDIDGTLLQHGKTHIDSEILEAIKKLVDKDIVFVVASGRQHESIARLFKEVINHIICISANGAMYKFNGNLHIPQHLNQELLEYIMNEVRKDTECEVAFSCEDGIYIESKNSKFATELNDVLHYQAFEVEDLLKVEKKVFAISVFAPNEVEAVSKKYSMLLGEKAHVITSGISWIDIMPLGINKGRALKHIIDELNISSDECMAFGDQWNDAEMLKLVKYSFAMNSSAPGISDFCKYKTETVLEELEKLL